MVDMRSRHHNSTHRNPELHSRSAPVSQVPETHTYPELQGVEESQVHPWHPQEQPSDVMVETLEAAVDVHVVEGRSGPATGSGEIA